MIANGVILAENDGLMRGVVRSVLLRVDLEVFPVANGAEAVALARQFQARLVILDVAMPQLNGLQACNQIRALPGYAATPIIMLTGYDDERIRAAADQFGASEFITKPFRPDLLLTRLRAILNLPPAERRDDLNRARVWSPGEHAPTGSRLYDVAAGVPAKVWDKELAVPSPPGEKAQLAHGREAIRILRGIERDG